MPKFTWTVRGTDTGAMLEFVLNELERQGWEIFAVTPANAGWFVIGRALRVAEKTDAPAPASPGSHKPRPGSNKTR